MDKKKDPEPEPDLEILEDEPAKPFVAKPAISATPKFIQPPALRTPARPIPSPVPPTPAPATNAFDFSEPEKPKKSKKNQLVEDENQEVEEQPRKKKKRSEDDDSDIRLKRVEKPKSKLPLILGIAGGAVVLLVFVAVGLFFALKPKPTTAVAGKPTGTTKTTTTTKATASNNPSPTTAATPPKAGGIPPGWMTVDEKEFTCWVSSTGVPHFSGSKPNDIGTQPEFNFSKYNSGNRSQIVTIIPLSQNLDASRARKIMETEIERRINLMLDKPMIDKRDNISMDRYNCQEWVASSSSTEATTIVFRFFFDRGRMYIVAAGGNALPESDAYIKDFFRGFKLK